MNCWRKTTDLCVWRCKKRRNSENKKSPHNAGFFVAGLELVVQTHAEDVIGRDTVSMVEVG